MDAPPLMRARRFWPLFWTQFLGAFNDNLFKNALVLLITFRSVTVGGLAPELMVAASGAIFIAPFFLFSAVAGQLADKLDKAAIVRATKVLELLIMGVGAAGLVTGQYALLLLVLFFMGTQSALFGPCKYAILPQHLGENELVRGNALVEMGTYLAILLGTIAGGLAVNVEGGERWAAAAVVGVAALGIGTAWFVPPAPSRAPDLVVSYNPLVPTWRLLQLAFDNVVIGRSVLAISWFWTFGSVFLSIFPAYTKDVLGGDPTIATFFLALFSVGIGAGSMLCERLSRHRVELGLVPIGSFGMSVFALDLWAIGQPWAAPAVPLDVAAFLSTWTGVRIALDLLLLAMSGGLLIVPLYAFVQLRARPEEVSRVIAANNVVNALAMVGGALALMGLFAAGLDTVDVLLALFAANTLVALYIYTVVPEFMVRFVVWTLSIPMYRLRVTGHEHIPKDGPVVIVANHVSFVDWFLLSAAVKRPARFVMHKDFFRGPLKLVARHLHAIPIASAKEDPEMMEAAFAAIARELDDGQVVVIFPEGRITDTGEMYPFRSGVERIVAANPVPIVPMAILGMWGSFFSRKDGQALKKPFRRWWSRVDVVIDPALPPDQVTAAGLQARVQAMLDRG